MSDTTQLDEQRATALLAQPDGALAGRELLAAGPGALKALLAAGQRQRVIAWIEAVQQEGDERPAVMHTLGLLHFWHAHELEGRGEVEPALAAWRAVIANWAPLLEDDAGWERWVAGRLAIYGSQLQENHATEARDLVNARCVERWRGRGEAARATGQPAIAAQYDELTLLLAVERAAVRRLRILFENV
jgi:hypothetical protein